MSRPQVSGNQMLGGLTLFYFVLLKQQGLAKANCIFNSGRGRERLHTHTNQTDFSKFVFLTRWKRHSSEETHLPCWGLHSGNVSSDGCVHTAALSELPSRRDTVICQEKNMTQALGGVWGDWAEFKGRVGFQLDKALP